MVFESVAVLYYLDVKYPQVPIFGTSPEEAGVIMRVICEFQTYAEPSLSKIVHAVFSDEVAGAFDELTDAMHVAGREARTIEGRLSKELWIVGDRLFRGRHGHFPWIQLLRRALDQAAGRGARSTFPAHGAKLSRARALDRAHRIPAGLRPDLSRLIGASVEPGIWDSSRRPVGWRRAPRGPFITSTRGNEKMGTTL